MIQGVSNYQLSAQTGYLTRQIDRIDVSRFQGCDRSLLMLGCGDGQALNAMARQHPDWRFVGVDFNQGYIDQAKSTAPENVSYLCSAFSQVGEIGQFGVIGACGLMSWISSDEREAVYALFSRCSGENGWVSFGFDSEFYWGEIKGIRETFLSLWQEMGDHHMALMLTKSLVSNMRFSSQAKKQYVDKLLSDPDELKHWLYQPHWHPMFPSQVVDSMRKAGFVMNERRSLANVASTLLLAECPYIHWSFRRAV